MPASEGRRPRRQEYLVPDAENQLRTWAACQSLGMSRWCGHELLDFPRDRALAELILSRRALVRVTDETGLQVA